MKALRATYFFHNKYLSPLILIATILLMWTVVSRVSGLPQFILPHPKSVVIAMWNSRAALFPAMLLTLSTAIIGLLLSVVLAFTVAIAMDFFRFVFRMCYPLIVLSQTIQILAVAPLIIIWFGFGVPSTIVIVVLFCFFPITIAATQGFNATPTEYLVQLRAMRANRWQVWRYCRFPAALPTTFAGIRVATAYAIISTTIGEWVGGTGGIGLYILRSKNALQTDQVFAGMLLCSLLSILLFVAVVILEHIFVPWYFKQRKTVFTETDPTFQNKLTIHTAERQNA